MNNNLIYYKHSVFKYGKKEKVVIPYNKAITLQTLDLYNTTIYNVVPLCNIIHNSKSLKTLILDTVDIKDKAIIYDKHKVKYYNKSNFELLGEAIGNNRSIQKIDLSLNSSVEFNDYNYEYTFDFNPILDGISKNRGIKTLRLNQNNLSSFKSSISKVIACNFIKELILAGCEIDDFSEITESLKCNSSITDIWLQKTKITNEKSFDTFYEYIKNSETLTKLDISVDFINIELLADALKENTYLKTLLILRLKNNNVLPLIEALKINKSLKELEIFRCDNFEGMDELIYSLQNNDSLQSLTIADTKLKSVDPICELIKNNKTLTYLNMYYHSYEDSDKIIDALMLNSTLKSINLKLCNIKNTDKIAELLLTNKSLEFLNLRCNYLRDLTKICNSLKINDTLQTLILSEYYDYFEDEDALTTDEITRNNLSICEMIKYNKGLKILKYCKNELGENIKELAEALQFNTTLTKLKISHNHIPDISIFYDTLVNNKTLTYIDCFDNYEKFYDINFDMDHKIIIKIINSLCNLINQNRTLITLYTDEYDEYNNKYNLDRKYIDQIKKVLKKNKVLKEYTFRFLI